MPLITLRLRAGLTPRRWVGISGSIAAHCSSFSQYSFAIHLTPAKLGSLNRNQPSRGKSYWFNWVLSLVKEIPLAKLSKFVPVVNCSSLMRTQPGFLLVRPHKDAAAIDLNDLSVGCP